MGKRVRLIDRLTAFEPRDDEVIDGHTGITDDAKSGTEGQLHKILKDVEFFKREIQLYTDQLHNLREELKSSQARYRKLFMFSPICYFSLDEDGKIREVNQATQRMLGLDRTSIVSNSILSFVSEPSHLRLSSYLKDKKPDENLLSSTDKNIEITFKHKDGQEIPTLLRIIRVEDAIQGVPHPLAAVVDIADRKAAEDALKESERRYRDHIDNIGDIVYVLDGNAKLSYVNATLEQIIGRPDDKEAREGFAKIVGRHVIRQPDDPSKGRETSRDSRFFEMDILDRKGRKRIFEVSETVVQLDGRIVEIHGIGRDVTEQKRYLNTIFESIADGVCSVDRDFLITSFNAAAERITNVPRTVAIGKACREIFQSSLCDGTCPIQSSVETGKPVIVASARIVTEEGARVPISLSATALRDEDGTVVGGVITFRDLSLIEDLRREISEKYSYQDIVSMNKRMREIFDVLPHIAESDSTVLIEGRSGTGKELFARAIHNLSPRKRKPFVAVNCAALPEALLESELFGYVVGAFTNAVKDKPGRFALAEGGTIFLDEITELPPSLQVKLLRVLQEREYEPLGSIKSSRADVRVIASTNREITQQVGGGKFREDLYYRLNIVTISLPDLKQRKEDIPLLTDHLIKKISAKKNRDIHGISDEAMNLLMSYDYPGNVRELENIIEHAFVLCRGPLILPEHLPGEFLRKTHYRQPTDRPPLDEIAAAEKRIIEETLSRHDGNKSKAARALNMGRTTLWRKIREYGIE